LERDKKTPNRPEPIRQTGRMSFRTRVAADRDSARLAALLGQLGYEVDPDVVEHELHAEVGTRVFVADHHDEIVGTIVVNLRRHLHLGVMCASIDALVVDDSRRSLGIGTALVDVAVVASRDAGAERIELNSDVDRIDARRFYERAGFAVVSNHFRRDLR
jgi:GNAT superfamily N-acetyltransferase